MPRPSRAGSVHSLVYQRAKSANDRVPFGTRLNVYDDGHEWLNPSSVARRPDPDASPRVTVGNDQCSQPYGASILNISAMSFGSLSAKAIRALNKGAAAYGGILPGIKVTEEITEAREVPAGKDCVSPASHPEFSTPIEMMEFIGRLRDLSGGKPVGFKLCVGHPWEFLGICKAMRETEIVPDFIVVDGSKGGTGAAPLELADYVGTPMREGLVFVHNALVGCELRDRVKIAAAGKVMSGFRIARNIALGADWCNSARGFMFALGCIQSLHCHTDQCPTGITTQNRWRQRGLDVMDKGERVRRFHARTVAGLNGIVAACGLEHPGELRPRHVACRTDSHVIEALDHVYDFLEPGELLAGTDNRTFSEAWNRARAGSFEPTG